MYIYLGSTNRLSYTAYITGILKMSYFAGEGGIHSDVLGVREIMG